MDTKIHSPINQAAPNSTQRWSSCVIRKGVVFALCAMIILRAAAVEALEPDQREESASRRGWLAMGIAFGVPTMIIGVGAINWWIDHRIKFNIHEFNFWHRGWFGRNTHTGGHDNLGHAYATYIGQYSVTGLYELAGYKRTTSIWLGTAVTAFGFNLIEFFDAFTDYGWEYTDTVFNFGGQALALLSQLYSLDRYLQLRISWMPSRMYATGKTGGMAAYKFLEDYNGQRFFIVGNTAGIADKVGLHLGLLRYLMPAVYYDTRGYRPQLPDEKYELRERNIGGALLLDASAILRERWPENRFLRGTASFLKFFQPPYLALGYGYDLNHNRWHTSDFSLWFTARF